MTNAMIFTAQASVLTVINHIHEQHVINAPEIKNQKRLDRMNKSLSKAFVRGL